MSDPSGSSAPKAIGSLAKKQSDITRQGTQKLKFVPTLPQRRKQESVKHHSEPVTGAPASPPKPARGRDRGRGDVRGAARGRGRGAPPAVEMTASGPFAMGPSGAEVRGATRGKRGAAPSVETTASGPFAMGSSRAGGVKVEDEEVYSDPDEGVEIVDMDQVQKIDWMAPDILRKARRNDDTKIKQEELDNKGNADSGRALNLNESEDEELEDVIEDFTTRANDDADESLHGEKLFLFQFPSPFPTFIKSNVMEVDQRQTSTEKKVTFAPDVKSDVSSGATSTLGATDPKGSERVSGSIGQLEVYRSGQVKMRFANGILLDVSASTQPSFLQQAVYLDQIEKQLLVLGEVNKQFVVSPNVEALLSALEKVEEKSASQDERIE